MSQYKKEQAEKLIVKHSCSHRGVHYYEVIDEKGKMHEVIISVNCTCTFQAVQGTANSDVCSDIIAVCKHISENADIKLDPLATRIDKRNFCKRFVKYTNREINTLRFSGNEGTLHRQKKEEICAELDKQKKQYITEAKMIDSSLIADIIILDELKIIEICDTELDESIKRKKESYEKLGLKFEIIKI